MRLDSLRVGGGRAKHLNGGNKEKAVAVLIATAEESETVPPPGKAFRFSSFSFPSDV